MNYKVSTYLTFNGYIEVINLPDVVYGEWIIYDNKTPKYHINCFRESSTSDLKINHLIKEKNENIESIIDKLNKINKTDLSLSIKPWPSLLTKSAIKNLELSPLPNNWVENIIQ